jgi:hypothetical protein
MTRESRENFIKTINHVQPEKVVVDFGATTVTGIHVRIVEKLREYYGLEKRPVKVFEPYQMLGEIDEDLSAAMKIDVIGLFGENNMFGIKNDNWKVHKTLWGQEVLLPGEFNYTVSNTGAMLVYPKGDISIKPSAMMPVTGYFFDAIERQGKINEETILEDNLEEFGYINDNDLKYWESQIKSVSNMSKGIVASPGGTALGDIALVPAVGLRNPKGIRSVTEWYMSILTRPDLVRNIFEKQSEIAIENLGNIFNVIGNNIDVVYICGTDFGTQTSTFCSPETYTELWLPSYKRINDWVHENTSWKTFKHSCGAIEPFIELFVKSGFDIINPVQINASGMDTLLLKKKYGDRIVFWGGGVDTQGVFAFGTPEQVSDQVKKQCEILNKEGGFVFNAIHNIQANVPFTNVISMLETLARL